MKKEGRMYEVGRKEGRKKGRKERWKSGGRKKIRKEERKEGRHACGCFLRGKLLIEGSNEEQSSKRHASVYKANA